MIYPDRSIPFVRAALDGSLEEAAEILRIAERRHGIRWSNSLEILEDSNEDVWYRQHLWPFLSETHFVLSGGDLQLSGCSLVGEDGLDHTPTWRHWGAILAEWANQYWQERPAGLGQTKWTQAVRPWDYLDFYSRDYLAYLISEYDQWVATLHEILLYRNANACD